jgi:polyhydroxyalkanoate synthase
VFLENRLLKSNKLKINGLGIDLKEINIPIFAFATKSDHIVPWQSTYAIKKICPKNTTFVLGASGHVSGIINPVHRNKYCYWTSKDLPKNSADWMEKSKENPGSWWPMWHNWAEKFLGKKTTTNMWQNTPNIEKAPGKYAVSSSPNT